MREFYGELLPEREVYTPTIREELEELSHDFFTTATEEDQHISTYENE